MNSLAPGASTSQGVQKRSIIEVLHELQRQIQAYGQGPFSPEQAKEVEKLKILYIKAKQQYDKQVKILQTSSMASQPTSIQAALPAGTPLPSSSPSVGITSVPTPQQVIKGQQAHIIHQLQSRGSVPVSNMSTTQAAQAAINAHVLSQQNLQIVGSVSNLITSSGTLAIVSNANGPGKGQVIYTTPNKQQFISRTQTQIRPVIPAVNMAANTITAGASNTTQQQLRMMGITTNQRAEVHGMQQGVAAVKQPTVTPLVTSPQPVQVLSRRKLQDLLQEIDPRETMDEDVEEVLLQMADDFIENVVGSACQLAKHRKSNTLELKDIQLHLDRHWNMWIPGFGNDDLRPHKKLATADAHRQRLAIIKKSLKK